MTEHDKSNALHYLGTVAPAEKTPAESACAPPPGDEFSQEGGVGAPLSPTGVAIYSDGVLKKKPRPPYIPPEESAAPRRGSEEYRYLLSAVRLLKTAAARVRRARMPAEANELAGIIARLEKMLVEGCA